MRLYQNNPNIIELLFATNDVIMNVYGNFSQAGETTIFNLDDATATDADSFRINTVGGIDIDSGYGISLADDSGSSLTIGQDGVIALTSAGSGTAAASVVAGDIIAVEVRKTQ